MGQKTHPKLFRLGVIESWDSKWFARHDYPKLLHEDFRVKKFLKSRLYHAGISRIEIERAANKAKINIHTARPGIIIGKKGAEIEKLKEEITNSRSERVTSTFTKCVVRIWTLSWLQRTSRCSWSVGWPFGAP